MKAYVFVNEEANFAAMDSNGSVYEYEGRPIIEDEYSHFFSNGNQWLTATEKDPSNWRESLTERKSDVAEWDGKGLPPIGVPVEFRINAWGSWSQHTITVHLYFHESETMCASTDNEKSFSGDYNRYEFRPVQTDKQRLIEKATVVINYTGLTENNHQSHIVASALYIAGMLKEPTL